MSLHDSTNVKATTPAVDYVTRWKSISREGDELFSDILARNAELEARVKTLEYENWTTRKMLEKFRVDNQTNEVARQELQSKIEILASQHESFKNENPIVVCLLDGDGCIFDGDLIRQGLSGGHVAAQKLLEGISNYLRTSSQRVPPGIRIVITIYMSMIGVESALLGNGVCKPEQFSAFFSGFGNAHPLISVVDVGSGKEAADNKIRESLDLFIRLPQTFRLFFGGGHDNGYHGTLAATSTIGHKEKLVILQSYSDLGREIGLLHLPTLSIPKLFMTEKLERRPLLKKSAAHASTSVYPSPQATPSKQKKNQAPVKAAKAARHKAKSDPPAPQVPSTPRSIPSQESEQILVNHRGGEHQLPCLNHHLSDEGCLALDCPFDHSSTVTAAQLHELKAMALMIPCRYLNSNKPCPLKECHFGHICPQGSMETCEAYQQGRCLFTGLGMHA